MQIVPEERCDVVKKNLNPVTTCHIYSVQKGKLKVILFKILSGIICGLWFMISQCVIRFRYNFQSAITGRKYVVHR